MKRILLSLLTIASVGAIAFGVSTAFFSDTETSSGNTFQAGSLDLKINGQDNPSGIVTIEDLKPGDDYFVEKILRVIDNPAKVWMHIKNLASEQGTQTEPEELEESQTAPKWDIENSLTYDLSVNDEVLIAFENGVLLPDVVSCWIPLGTLPGGEDVIVEQSFHFPSGITNWAQGDILTFTEEFYAAQDRNNPDATPPDLGTDRFWSEQEKRCVDVDPYADAVTEVDGTFGAPTTLSSDPGVAEPLVTGAPDGQFIQISDDSSVTLKFVDNKAVPGPGNDIKIYIFDALFPASAEIFISQDGSTFFSAGVFDDTAHIEIDIELVSLSLTSVSHVKIVDLVGEVDFPLLGFDLDAVEALNTIPTP